MKKEKLYESTRRHIHATHENSTGFVFSHHYVIIIIIIIVELTKA